MLSSSTEQTHTLQGQIDRPQRIGFPPDPAQPLEFPRPAPPAANDAHELPPSIIDPNAVLDGLRHVDAPLSVYGHRADLRETIRRIVKATDAQIGRERPPRRVPLGVAGRGNQKDAE